MAGVPEKVLNWLYSVLPSEYADVNRTYHDVAETLSNYPSLSPRTEVYTYENGASALLLLLSGTLPVTFRGATYGFPVAIWVPHAYPRESPIVYITPSQDMLVRPGQHVSGDGRVYHPYLAQWGKYWDKSTIFDFLAVLRGVFAKEPPVRSKQQQQQQQFNPPDQQAPPPRPPPPEEYRRSIGAPSVPSPSSRPSSQAPAPPPKPPKPYEQGQGTPQPHPEGRYSQPPPLPPQPPKHPQQQYQQHTQRNSYASQSGWQQPGQPPQHIPQRQATYDMGPSTQSQPQRHHINASADPHYQHNSYQVGSPVSPLSPEDQQQSSRYQQPAPLPPTQAQPQGHHPPQQQHQYQQQQQHPQQPQQQQQYGGPQQPKQPAYQQQQHPPPHQQHQQQQYPHQPPYPTHQGPPPTHYNQQQQAAPPAPKPPINLLDDTLEVTLPSQTGQQPNIPVPPVPPNPEKDALLQALSQTLCTQIRSTVSSNTSAITPLRAQQTALQSAHHQLQSELEQLKQLDAALASNEHILREAMVEADRVMEEARLRKVPDVDDVLVAPTVVGGQLYVLAAEERGIADALFVLGRGLDKGRVGADVFVKQTRSLAREQFLKKALIKKIAKGMALDDYQMR